MRIVAALLALLSASSVLAAEPAPPLMRPPSKVAFVSTGMDFPPSASSFGMDETGAVYGSYGPGSVFNYLTCWPKGAKTMETGKLLFDFEQKNNPQAVPPYWLGMTSNHSHALFARIIDGSLTLGKARCDDPNPPIPLQLSVVDEPLLATFKMPMAEQGRRLDSTATASRHGCVAASLPASTSALVAAPRFRRCRANSAFRRRRCGAGRGDSAMGHQTAFRGS